MGNQRQGLTDSKGEKGRNCGSQAAYPVLDDGARRPQGSLRLRFVFDPFILKLVSSFTLGFFNPSATDIWGWIILYVCGGGGHALHVHCRVVSSTPGFYSQDTSSIRHQL